MIAWLLRWFRPAQPEGPFRFHEEAVERHLRELGLSPWSSGSPQ